MFRLSISRKISLSLMLVLIVSTIAMAWLTAQSLQSGFNDFLKQKQLLAMEKVSAMLAQYYHEHGDFSKLRHNPRVVRPLIDQALGRTPPEQFSTENIPSDTQIGSLNNRSHPVRARPPRPEESRNLTIGMGIGIGPGITLLDQQDQPVFGPLRLGDNNLIQPILLGGIVVGKVLAPVPEFFMEKPTLDFVQNQMLNIIFLAFGLIVLATIVSIWLGKHLTRPIAGLRHATQEIANGRLNARVTMMHQDEIGDLAQHINSMASHLEIHDQKRKKIMADLSHELRTPLTVMRAEVEALIDGVRPLNMASVHSLEAEIKHLNKLVEDLYELALADAGALRFQFSNVDICHLLEQIGSRFQIRMQQSELNLKLELLPHPVWVHADSSRITQVIENLLENSLRYTDASGQIELKIIALSSQVHIILEDSAPGLADADYEKIFDRLYREDKARSRVKGGSGLGLAICRSLIQRHSGEIKASASSLGGIKMMISLPSLEAAKRSHN